MHEPAILCMPKSDPSPVNRNRSPADTQLMRDNFIGRSSTDNDAKYRI